MKWLIPYVSIAFQVYNWLIIIRVLLSWVPHNPNSSVTRFIYEITEPVLAPFRRLMGGSLSIDFSPIVAIFVLQFVEWIVLNLLNAI